MAVALDCRPFMPCVVASKEFFREVVDKLDDMLRLPFILALIVVNAVGIRNDQSADWSLSARLGTPRSKQ